MKLSFPNPSRSFDSTKQRVQFWAYHNTVEITFYIDGATLQLLQPTMTDDQEGLLTAFDANTEKIRKVADKVYQGDPSRGSSYLLPSSQF